MNSNISKTMRRFRIQQKETGDSKMTIITGLEYIEVEPPILYGSAVLVRSFKLGWNNRYPNIPSLKDAEPPEKELAYTNRSIRGRRICTPNGKEVFLGNAPEVEEFLGLQFDLFENMEKEKNDALSELSKAEKEKSDAFFESSRMQQRVKELERAVQKRDSESRKREEEINTMSFFRRLKFLFTGELV